MWNYRLILHDDKKQKWVGIHRVYYNNCVNKAIVDFCPNPVRISDITTEELKWKLEKINKCFNKPTLFEKDGELYESSFFDDRDKIPIW